MSVQMSSGIISLDDPELTNFSVDCVQKYYLLERLLIFSYIFFRIKFPREACADLLTYFTKISVLALPGMNYDLPETCEHMCFTSRRAGKKIDFSHLLYNYIYISSEGK